MSCEGYKWYVGVPHCHTVASDGGLTLEQVIEKRKKQAAAHVRLLEIVMHCQTSLFLVLAM